MSAEAERNAGRGGATRSPAPDAPLPPPASEAALQFSSRYEIFEGSSFASGGSAEVFRATRRSDQATVAVKVFKLPAKKKDQESCMRDAHEEYAVRQRIGSFP